MTRAAFTLLETLLTISLTAAVGIAAVTLMTVQARVGAAAHAQEDALAQITETARLLDGDLLLAARLPGRGRFQIREHGDLRLVTACRLPGETAGPHEVVWHFEPAAGMVFRTSVPQDGGEAITRPIGRGWKAFAVWRDRDRLWLDARLDVADIPWRIPLWTEAP